jgi:hypothetical protein
LTADEKHRYLNVTRVSAHCLTSEVKELVSNDMETKQYTRNYEVICGHFYFVLQTLNTISAEKNSTIVFPLPIDLLTYFVKAQEAVSK